MVISEGTPKNLAKHHWSNVETKIGGIYLFVESDLFTSQYKIVCVEC